MDLVAATEVEEVAGTVHEEVTLEGLEGTTVVDPETEDLPLLVETAAGTEEIVETAETVEAEEEVTGMEEGTEETLPEVVEEVETPMVVLLLLGTIETAVETVTEEGTVTVAAEEEEAMDLQVVVAVVDMTTEEGHLCREEERDWDQEDPDPERDARCTVSSC